MDKSLVCRVLVPILNRSYPSISTGYAVKQGVVLLARHALLHELRNPNLPVQLVWDEWLDAEGEPCKIDAEQGSESFIPQEQDVKADIALLKCTTPPQTTVQCCPLLPESFPSFMGWEAYGFPRFKQSHNEDVAYDATTVIGKTKSSNSNGVVELSCSDDLSDRDQWAGVSGAAVFRGIYLLGVITSNWLEHENALEGYSLAYHVKKYPAFAELLGIATEDDMPSYLKLLEPILHKTPKLAEQLTGQISTKPVDCYQQLVSVSVGEFFQTLLDCRDKGSCPKTLGELASVMLPQFVAPNVVSYVRVQACVSVVSVPYARGLVIESLMARVDRRCLAIDQYANGKFIAHYALSCAAETAERTDDRLRETMQDLDYRQGGDLLALHTQQLYKKTKPSDLPDKQGDMAQMERRVKRLLQAASKRNAPKHYLVHEPTLFTTDQEAQQYYVRFKQQYPECVVIKPTENEELIEQELDDYFDAETILTPYLNGDPQ